MSSGLTRPIVHLLLQWSIILSTIQKLASLIVTILGQRYTKVSLSNCKFVTILGQTQIIWGPPLTTTSHFLTKAPHDSGSLSPHNHQIRSTKNPPLHLPPNNQPTNQPTTVISIFLPYITLTSLPPNPIYILSLHPPLPHSTVVQCFSCYIEKYCFLRITYQQVQKKKKQNPKTMARQVIVLALIFLAVAGLVSAQSPSSSPASAPKSSASVPASSPKASSSPASSPTSSGQAPTSDSPSESTDSPISSPPAPEDGSPAFAPEPAADGPIADDVPAPAPAKSGAATLKVSAAVGAAAVAGFFF